MAWFLACLVALMFPSLAAASDREFSFWLVVQISPPVRLASVVTLLFIYLTLEPHHPCASSTLLDRLAVTAKLQRRLILMFSV
jgi:hypothetical protein